MSDEREADQQSHADLVGVRVILDGGANACPTDYAWRSGVVTATQLVLTHGGGSHLPLATVVLDKIGRERMGRTVKVPPYALRRETARVLEIVRDAGKRPWEAAA